MKINRVFFDTSFFIRLLDQTDADHANALAYYRRFRDEKIPLFTSTIVLAEFGVLEDINHLPLRELSLLAFDINHARIAAKIAKAAYLGKRKGAVVIEKRVIIPNDTKLFAQATEVGADYFIGRDDNAKKVLAYIRKEGLSQCEYLDIRTPPTTFFGELF